MYNLKSFLIAQPIHHSLIKETNVSVSVCACFNKHSLLMYWHFSIEKLHLYSVYLRFHERLFLIYATPSTVCSQLCVVLCLRRDIFSVVFRGKIFLYSVWQTEEFIYHLQQIYGTCISLIYISVYIYLIYILYFTLYGFFYKTCTNTLGEFDWRSAIKYRLF